MRAYLIAPVNERGASTSFPIGIACVSAALKQAGHEVESINLGLCEDPVGSVLEDIRRFKPGMVGLGGLTPSFRQLRGVHQAIRQAFPGMVTVLGGGVLTSAVDIVFGAVEPDFGVIGEGELTMTELAACLDRGDDPMGVDGLIFRLPGGPLHRTPPRAPIHDLDTLPIPDYAGLKLQTLLDRGVFLEVLGSRGCPYSCTFCYSPLGRRYRQRSLDHLFSEIEHVVSQYGMKTMGITDELFASSPARVSEFCERIGPLGVSWITQLRVDSVDESTLRRMRKAGCTLISYGLESMHSDVLRSMNKKITPDKIEKTLELTYESGISVFGNFIFGDPAETKQTASHTIEWWFNNRKHLINLGSLICWPGSKIYNDAVERGIIADELAFIADGCPETNLTAMSDADYWKLLRRNHLYHNVLLYPGRALDVRPEGEDSWRLEMVCPHCGDERIYNGVGDNRIPFNRSTVRLGCVCGRQFDLPMLIPPANIPKEFMDEAERLAALAEAGDGEALQKLEELSDTHKRFALARWRTSRIHFKAGDMAKAYLYTAKALLADPTIPGFHAQMADILNAMGEPRPASVFQDQARLLQSCQPKGWINPVDTQ